MQGGVLPLTVPGIPMLFMGQELYETGVFEFPSPSPLEWDNSHSGIRTLYRDAITLRRNLTAQTRGLTGPTMTIFHQNDAAKVMAWLRRSSGGPGDDTVVVANFSATDFSFGYQIGVPSPGTWQIRFTTDSQTYDTAFSTPATATTTLTTQATPLQGYPQRLNIPRLPPYTLLILSQDAPNTWWLY